MNYYVFENVPDLMCEFREMRTKFNMSCQHYHTAYEILFMTGGDRYAFFNDGTYHLGKGDIAVFEPYTLHLTENRESNYFKRYVVNFSEKAFAPLFTEAEGTRFLSGLKTGIIHLDGADFDFAKKICRMLADEAETSDRYHKKLLGVRLAGLIDILKGKRIEPKTALKAVGQSGSIAKTINYINEHFTENLTLDFVVSYAHMSKANFCLVFKRETGSTFLQYLNNHRVAYAHSLLMETDLSIQRIAERTGFSSVLHFDRVFKGIHGAAPSAIRKTR